MPEVLQSATSHSSQPGEKIQLDPLFHLLPPKKTKHLAIIKYLYAQGQVEEDEIWTDKRTSLVVKTGQSQSHKRESHAVV